MPSIGIDAKTPGKNQVVAILDTGLDTSHEAFSGAVNDPKYTERDIAAVLKSNSLRIGNVNVKSIYHQR